MKYAFILGLLIASFTCEAQVKRYDHLSIPQDQDVQITPGGIYPYGDTLFFKDAKRTGISRRAFGVARFDKFDGIPLVTEANDERFKNRMRLSKPFRHGEYVYCHGFYDQGSNYILLRIDAEGNQTIFSDSSSCNGWLTSHQFRHALVGDTLFMFSIVSDALTKIRDLKAFDLTADSFLKFNIDSINSKIGTFVLTMTGANDLLVFADNNNGRTVIYDFRTDSILASFRLGYPRPSTYYSRNDSLFVDNNTHIGSYANGLNYFNHDGSFHSLARHSLSPNVRGFETRYKSKVFNPVIRDYAIDRLGNQFLLMEPIEGYPSLVKIKPNGLQDIGFHPDLGSALDVTGIELCNNQLFITGRFQAFRNHSLVVVSATSGKVISRLINSYVDIESIASDSSYVYLGGSFSYSHGGKTYNNVFRIAEKTLAIDTSWVWSHSETGKQLNIHDTILFTGLSSVSFNKNTQARLNILPPNHNISSCTSLGKDSFLSSTQQGVFLHTRHGGTYRVDTILFPSVGAVEAVSIKGRKVLIASHSSLATIRRFDLDSWDWDTFLVKGSGRVNMVYENDSYVLIAGSVTCIDPIPGNNLPPLYKNHSYLDIPNQKVSFIEFTSNRPDIEDGTHRAQQLLGDSTLVQFPFYWHSKTTSVDSTYIRLTHLDTKRHEYILVEPNRSTTSVHPYAISDFSCNNDTLFGLYGNHPYADSVTLLRLSTGRKLGSIKLSCAPCGKYLYVDDSTKMISEVQEDITLSDHDLRYSKGFAGTRLTDNLPVHLAFSVQHGKSHDWVFFDSLLCSAEIMETVWPHQTSLNILNLNTGDTSELLRYIPQLPANIEAYGEYVYFNERKSTFTTSRINWKTKSGYETIATTPLFTILDQYLYLQENGNLTRLDLTNDSTKNFGYIGHYDLSQITMFHYGPNLGFITHTKDKTQYTLHLYDTANGREILSRKLPDVMVDRAFGKDSKIQHAGDYLIFKTSNNKDNDLTSQTVGYHIFTGLLDTTLFTNAPKENFVYHIYDTDSGYTSYATELRCGDAFGQPCSSNGWLDNIYCDEIDVLTQPLKPYKHLKPQYISHKPNIAGQSRIAFVIQSIAMPEMSYYYLLSGKDTIHPILNSTRNLGGAILTCRFDLTASNIGSYDLHLFTDGDTFIVPDALEVAAPQEAAIDLSCIVRDSLRVNKFYPGRINVTNRSNTDAYLTPILIHFKGMEIDVEHEVNQTKQKLPGWSTLYSNVQNGWKSQYFLLPFIGANESVEIHIDIKGTTGTGELNVSAAKPLINPPFTNFDSSIMFSLFNYMDCKNLGQNNLRDSCFNLYFGSGLKSNILDYSYAKEFNKNHYIDDPQRGSTHGPTAILDLRTTLFEYLSCVNHGVSNSYKSSQEVVQALIQLHIGTSSGSCSISDSQQRFNYEVVNRCNKQIAFVNSIDPNYKSGPSGKHGSMYTDALPDLFEFDVLFENDPSATASAQTITIKDSLDLDLFDVKSITFSSIQLGNNRYWLSGDRTALNHEFAITNGGRVKLKASSQLDTASGVLDMVLEGVHLITGLQSDLNASDGILPPNDANGNGQGSISFSIKAKPGNTVSIARNSATIVFDDNHPITTNTWELRLDTTIPSSIVLPITDNGSNMANIEWVARDNISGIAYYDIYMSVNNGPYQLWQQATTKTSEVYYFDCDSIYSFYSIATDSFGKREIKKDVPDAVITPSCELAKHLSCSTKLIGQKGVSQLNYFSAETTSLSYQMESSIHNDTNVDQYLKQLHYVFDVTPELSSYDLKLSNVEIAGQQYTIDATLTTAQRVLKIIPYSKGSLEILGWIDDGKAHIRMTSLDHKGLESHLKDEGFILVPADSNTSINLNFIRTNLGGLEHNTVCSARSSASINQHIESNVSTWTNVMDSKPPRSIIGVNSSTLENHVKIHWTSSDSQSGVQVLELSILTNGNLIRKYVLSASETSKDVPLPFEAKFKAIVLGTDSVGNKELANTDNTIEDITASVSEVLWSDDVVIYPNPSQGNIRLSFAKTHSNTSVKIYDRSGKLVHNQSLGTMNAAQLELDLAEGIYTLEIISQEKVWQLPIVLH